VADPYERGREFGAAHGERVATTVAAYRRLIGPGVDLDRWGPAVLARIAGWAPDLAEEITGIAAGAGLPPGLVAAINARTELLAAADVLAGHPPGRDECSVVVDLGRAGGSAVAGQTWDWYVELADNWLVWTIPFPDGRRVTTLTEYGVVGKIGVNARGVGVLFTMLHHRADGRGAGGAPVGVPVHVVARRVLDEARDPEHAYGLCATAEVSASSSLTMVGPTGVVCAELWPGGPDRVEPEAGQLLHTNHFRAARPAAGDEAVERGSTTHVRYAALSGLVADRAGALTPADLDAALGDHGGGVCRHPAGAAGPAAAHATLATVRLDLAAADLDVTPGPVCGR
jgi:isopenicillin-N N-acyltransferase-like protein